MVEQEGRDANQVKAAIAEAAGDVAANLAALDGAPLAGNAAQNQLLRVCFDGLGAPANGSSQVQQTAAAALAQVRSCGGFCPQLAASSIVVWWLDCYVL